MRALSARPRRRPGHAFPVRLALARIWARAVLRAARLAKIRRRCFRPAWLARDRLRRLLR